MRQYFKKKELNGVFIHSLCFPPVMRLDSNGVALFIWRGEQCLPAAFQADVDPVTFKVTPPYEPGYVIR
jgi:hypothetical protein